MWILHLHLLAIEHAENLLKSSDIKLWVSNAASIMLYVKQGKLRRQSNHTLGRPYAQEISKYKWKLFQCIFTEFTLQNLTDYRCVYR